MILLNFSHPITSAQRAQIEALTGQAIAQSIDAMPHFEEQQDHQDRLALPLGWRQCDLRQQRLHLGRKGLLSLNFIAAALAEAYGRIGYFPPVVRTRPVAGSTPRLYEVAEIINLQVLRDAARERRLA